MRSLYLRSLALAAAAAVFASGPAHAQEKGGLLNKVELRQLVARAEPADNARLSAHFSALAEQYAAEARKHGAMSKDLSGNPSLKWGGAMSTHCRRLAALNTESAATARELAEYHGKLAAGAPAAPPRDAARFHEGAGAPEATAPQIGALEARAAAPSDHRALQEYFAGLATRYASEASEHAALAKSWRTAVKYPNASAIAAHCDRLAAELEKSAKEARAAAEIHQGMAQVPQ